MGEVLQMCRFCSGIRHREDMFQDPETGYWFCSMTDWRLYEEQEELRAINSFNGA